MWTSDSNGKWSRLLGVKEMIQVLLNASKLDTIHMDSGNEFHVLYTPQEHIHHKSNFLQAP